ncbi:hypothetical protein DFH08DRAFT_940741 [Mycena albidolilacea]|uniref:Uncharacterized protein n=1 Tax=Mycena albidolilacea TaxID=1033008 RepID=A0AAD7EJZ8_9AGAR|nr:hypothetical protein DFH08DRAFT_940741 [Mycena albidolilacea]
MSRWRKRREWVLTAVVIPQKRPSQHGTPVQNCPLARTITALGIHAPVERSSTVVSVSEQKSPVQHVLPPSQFSASGMQPVYLPSRVQLPNGDPETVTKRLAAATKTTEILETISRSGVGWKIASYGLAFIQAIMGMAMLEPSVLHFKVVSDARIELFRDGSNMERVDIILGVSGSTSTAKNTRRGRASRTSMIITSLVEE